MTAVAVKAASTRVKPSFDEIELHFRPKTNIITLKSDVVVLASTLLKQIPNETSKLEFKSDWITSEILPQIIKCLHHGLKLMCFRDEAIAAIIALLEDLRKVNDFIEFRKSDEENKIRPCVILSMIQSAKEGTSKPSISIDIWLIGEVEVALNNAKSAVPKSVSVVQNAEKRHGDGELQTETDAQDRNAAEDSVQTTKDLLQVWATKKGLNISSFLSESKGGRKVVYQLQHPEGEGDVITVW
jgi:hypothetical protein